MIHVAKNMLPKINTKIFLCIKMQNHTKDPPPSPPLYSLQFYSPGAATCNCCFFCLGKRRSYLFNNTIKKYRFKKYKRMLSANIFCPTCFPSLPFPFTKGNHCKQFTEYPAREIPFESFTKCNNSRNATHSYGSKF